MCLCVCFRVVVNDGAPRLTRCRSLDPPGQNLAGALFLVRIRAVCVDGWACLAPRCAAFPMFSFSVLHLRSVLLFVPQILSDSRCCWQLRLLCSSARVYLETSRFISGGYRTTHGPCRSHAIAPPSSARSLVWYLTSKHAEALIRGLPAFRSTQMDNNANLVLL